MVCEKCASEFGTLLCTHCGMTVIKLGTYCYECGKAFEVTSDKTEESDGLDLSTRILCSDGTCIGVVDEKGVCKTCGKPYVPESQE
jgi:hypothetical protein